MIVYIVSGTLFLFLKIIFNIFTVTLSSLSAAMLMNEQIVKSLISNVIDLNCLWQCYIKPKLHHTFNCTKLTLLSKLSLLFRPHLSLWLKVAALGSQSLTTSFINRSNANQINCSIQCSLKKNNNKKTLSSLTINTIFRKQLLLKLDGEYEIHINSSVHNPVGRFQRVIKWWRYHTDIGISFFMLNNIW